MPHSNTKQLAALTRHVLRPALVEAKLVTEKYAHDKIYAVTLAEELRMVETKIAALEDALGLKCADVSCGQLQIPCHADWFHTKSGELDRRLKRIEQNDRIDDFVALPV